MRTAKDLRGGCAAKGSHEVARWPHIRWAVEGLSGADTTQRLALLQHSRGHIYIYIYILYIYIYIPGPLAVHSKHFELTSKIVLEKEALPHKRSCLRGYLGRDTQMAHKSSIHVFQLTDLREEALVERIDFFVLEKAEVCDPG